MVFKNDSEASWRESFLFLFIMLYSVKTIYKLILKKAEEIGE